MKGKKRNMGENEKRKGNTLYMLQPDFKSLSSPVSGRDLVSGERAP